MAVVTEKRRLDDNVFSTKHIVMDIEGTTTSISFVKDTLFPYVRKNLDSYLSSHWDEEEFKAVLSLLKDQAAEDQKAKMEGAIDIPSEGSSDDVKAAVAKSVLWQMDADRKTSALKKLQGHMWRQGYKSGELKGHLFSDVTPALREWVKDGKKLYVYSSGSVEAQKLLFGNSTEGDLTELFTDFFDTGVGAKIEADSYKSIVKKLNCQADDVLFLTDLPKEASAAREAGLPVILVEREGNEPIASDVKKEFSSVTSFQDLEFETAIKKQKVESENGDTKLKTAEPESNSNGHVEAMEVVAEPKNESKVEEQSKDSMDVDSSKETEEKEASKEEVSVDASDKSESAAEVVTETSGESGNVVPQSDTTSKQSEVIAAEPSKEDVKESTADQTEVSDVKSTENDKVEKTDEVVAELKTDTVTPAQATVSKETEIKELESKEDEKTVEKDAVKVVDEEEVSKKSEDVESAKTDNKDTVSEAETVKAVETEAKEESKVEETKETAIETTKTDESESTDTVQNNVSDSDEKPTAIVKSDVETKPEEKKEAEASIEVSENGNAKEIIDKVNGVANGTNGEAKKTDSNGTVENGHGKSEIPEIPVAKTAPQIGDATVALEA